MFLICNKDSKRRFSWFVEMFFVKNRLQCNDPELWLSICFIEICVNVENESKRK